MGRALEISLLKELKGLRENGLFFLDDSIQLSPVERYLSADRFECERSRIFRQLPMIAAHTGELPESGSFLTRQLGGLPVLLTRDRDGAVNAFVNVCRQRSGAAGLESGANTVLTFGRYEGALHKFNEEVEKFLI